MSSEDMIQQVKEKEDRHFKKKSNSSNVILIFAINEAQYYNPIEFFKLLSPAEKAKLFYN